MKWSKNNYQAEPDCEKDYNSGAKHEVQCCLGDHPGFFSSHLSLALQLPPRLPKQHPKLHPVPEHHGLLFIVSAELSVPSLLRGTSRGAPSSSLQTNPQRPQHTAAGVYIPAPSSFISTSAGIFIWMAFSGLKLKGRNSHQPKKKKTHTKQSPHKLTTSASCSCWEIFKKTQNKRWNWRHRSD